MRSGAFVGDVFGVDAFASQDHIIGGFGPSLGKVDVIGFFADGIGVPLNRDPGVWNLLYAGNNPIHHGPIAFLNIGTIKVKKNQRILLHDFVALLFGQPFFALDELNR